MRLQLALVLAIFASAVALAQGPREPRMLPPLKSASPLSIPLAPQGPSDPKAPAIQSTIKLPHQENSVPILGSSLVARRQNENWQIWSGHTLIREFGKQQGDAEEVVKQLRELRPTEWVTIGRTRPMIEYGLTKGEAYPPTYEPKHAAAVDLKSVRAENVRGAWVLRDDASILINFGLAQADAEQAAAVAQRYGFNRIGWVGEPNPVITYFYAMPGAKPPLAPGLGELMKHHQEQHLTRTGIDVAGLGFVGERIVIDAKKIEVRKDKNEYVLAHGNDVLAKFGASEWSARDALKVVQDLKATEFCRFNADITFFLVNGQAPTRVPFSVQGVRFDSEGLKVRAATGGKFALYDGVNRQVFGPFETETEAEQLMKLIKHYKFDQTCQQGLSSRGGLRFLAKQGR